MGSKVRRRKQRRQNQEDERNGRSEKRKGSGHDGPQRDRETSQETVQGDYDPGPESVGACLKCWIRDRCMEQRGRCALFKTPKQARKEAREDVRRINQNRDITDEPAGTEIQD